MASKCVPEWKSPQVRRFERYNQKLRRRIKPKKLTALKAKIKALTPTPSGWSMSEIICLLNRPLRGAFEHSKHFPQLGWDGVTNLSRLDSRVRYRLRRLLGKNCTRMMSGLASFGALADFDQYFHELGLHSLRDARELFIHFHS